MSRKKGRMSRKKGGMYRTAAKKIFTEVFKGKNPVERADKAKDVITAVLEGVETQTTRAPTTSRRSVSTFLENQTAFSPKVEHESLKHVDTHEPEHSYKTPKKYKMTDQDEPKITKINRHRSSVTLTPQSYAPTLENLSPNVNRELF